MSLRIHIAQAGSTRKAAEGLRIGVVRFLPRGVRKSEYARLNYFDVWLPNPCAESRSALAVQVLEDVRPNLLPALPHRDGADGAPADDYSIGQIANRQPIILCCYCEDETRCHRSVLIRLVREAGEK